MLDPETNEREHAVSLDCLPLVLGLGMISKRSVHFKACGCLPHDHMTLQMEDLWLVCELGGTRTQ